MNSTTQRLLLPFEIVIACLIGGSASLLDSRGRTTYWQDKDYWIFSICSHCVLIASTFWIFREEKVSLNTGAGLFNTFTLALICSVTVLLLFLMGFYVPIGLIFTGRALLTSFVATTVYALLRTFD